MAAKKQKLDLASQLGQIIPVDPETCNEIVEYGLGLKNEKEIASHFLNLLGESDETFDFLSKFMSVKSSVGPGATYTKPIVVQKENSPKREPQNAWSTPKSASAPKPVPSKPQKAARTTSELLKENPTEEKTSKRDRRRNLDNLKDLEVLLNSLEVTGSKDKSTVCYCNATRHPLFEVAPNCLNCGKIICSKEGLQPCSFCGHELLSAKERGEIQQVLRQEKEILEHKGPSSPKPTSEPVKAKPKKIVVAMNGGESFWKAQEKAFKRADEDRKLKHEQENLEKKRNEEEQQQEKVLKYYEQISDKDPELVAAQERLNNLLDFQENGVERTKIIDNAADYDLPSSNSGNMWLSATERALRLKKQHRQLRKQEEQEAKRSGRGERAVEMVIRDGKVTMVEKNTLQTAEEKEEKDQDIEALESELHRNKRLEEAAMANNVWDYMADENKWEKPVYASHNRLKSSGIDDGALLRQRVQQNASGDATELVVSMI